MTLPFLDFSRLFVCPLYALGEPNNTEKVNVAICSHFFLDWLAYLVLLLQNYKNGISARRTYLQRHIRSSITQNGSDNFSSGISENLPKIATSNVIFSRTADCIAAEFCMTIQKIKPNDIFQNCVHSTSSLN